MRRRLVFILAGLTACLLLSGCMSGTVTVIDWTDFIKWDGITYQSTDLAIKENMAGGELGNIEKTAPSSVTLPYEPGDKEAGWLAAGTVVYEIKECEVSSAIAAYTEGSYRVYIPEGQPLPDVLSKLAGRKGGKLSCYLAIIDDIYAEDPGLNGDIEMIALNTAKMDLTEEERQALLEGVMARYPELDVIDSTYEKLKEDGMIDEENLYFEKGILITIEDQEYKEEEGIFTFAVDKWRSGLGAIGSDDARAEWKGGMWVITKENIWIS